MREGGRGGGYFDIRRRRRRRDLRKKTEVITPTIRTWVPKRFVGPTKRSEGTNDRHAPITSQYNNYGT